MLTKTRVSSRVTNLTRPSNNTQILSQQVLTITHLKTPIVPGWNVTSCWQFVVLTLDMCRNKLVDYEHPKAKCPKVVIHVVALYLCPRGHWLPSLPKDRAPFSTSHSNPSIPSITSQQLGLSSSSSFSLQSALLTASLNNHQHAVDGSTLGGEARQTSDFQPA